MLVVTIAAALVTSGGIAWAGWRLTATGRASATAGTVLALQLSGRPEAALYPGRRSALYVTIRNENRFPVLVTRTAAGPGPVVADPAHQAAGCRTTGVSLIKQTNTVSWRILARSTGTFRVTDGVRMSNASDGACVGATFTVPLTATGRSDAR